MSGSGDRGCYSGDDVDRMTHTPRSQVSVSLRPFMREGQWKPPDVVDKPPMASEKLPP